MAHLVTLRNVSPRLASHNLLDRALSHAIGHGKRHRRLSGLHAHPDGSYMRGRQLRAGMLLASGQSSLRGSVAAILGMRSEEQVSRVAARRVVAGMAQKPIWPFAMGQEPEHSVGGPVTTLEPYLSVSSPASVCCPLPALIGSANTDIAPEPVQRRYAQRLVVAGVRTVARAAPSHIRGIPSKARSTGGANEVDGLAMLGTHSADLLHRSVGAVPTAGDTARRLSHAPIIPDFPAKTKEPYQWGS